MKGFKSWSTRRLREAGHEIPKTWTAGGSKRYIFNEDKLLEKIHYVIYEQGSPMQYYLDETLQPRGSNHPITEA